MVRLLDRAGLTALLARLALIPLVGYKGLQRGRWLLDAHGGFARAGRDAARWAEAWAAGSGSLSQWLARPGGGRLWIDPGTGRRWARRGVTPEDLAWVEEIVAGRIPLLGAAPEVGNPPRWLRDGYTGRPWPLVPAAKYRVLRGDGSDIRTVWELSRCYHFIPLARVYWRTGDRRILETFRAHVESWLRDNPAGLGPNWCSPMDAAIRGANWALATVLLAEAPEMPSAFWGSLLANLRQTARFIERHLEWHPVYRGNHYISNGVGLVYLGALFGGERDGDRWLRTGARILENEMDRQVHPDGTSFEAAIGYHRLVTEFFGWGGEVCRRSLPGTLSEAYWKKLAAMHHFIDSYLDSAGRAPLLGDADDGRLHLLCAETAADPRRHRLGLPPRPAAPAVRGSQAFPDGGFYVLRHRNDRCIVRCGPVGLAGAGSHDHNDQLSYELVLRGNEVVADSGTYAYTRDLAARHAYRSTAAHNTIQAGEEEQNPIRPDRPWRVLADRTSSQCLEWSVGVSGTRFVGEHRGYAHRASGARCTRTIGVELPDGDWTVEDLVDGRGTESLTWRLHFAPGLVRAEPAGPGRFHLTHDAATEYRIELVAPESMQLQLESSPWSERYGVAVPRRVAVLRGSAALPARVTLSIRPLERSA